MELKNVTREIITPEIAKQYLGMNEGNRVMRKTAVAAYADDMKSGRWNDSPDIMTPIMFSREGRLIDGQHRLAAVVQSGVSVVMYVRKNCDDSVYKYLDAGVKRSAADQIDSASAKLVAALAIRAVATRDGNSPLASCLNGVMNQQNGTHRVTRQQIIEFCEQENGNAVLTHFAHDGRNMKKSVAVGSPTTYSYFLWLETWLGRGEDLDNFKADFISLAPESRTIAACKATLQRAGLTTSAQAISLKWTLGNLLYAYDHYIAGDDTTSFNRAQAALATYDKLIAKKRKELRE